MPRAAANGIQIEYETFGRPQDPAIVLIMGLGGQLILWPENFCRTLADAGFHVVRFDNRDVGLSSKVDHAPRPRLLRAGLASLVGIRVAAPYSLDDMARDTLGLMDALGLEHAHVVGVSMGGMIAQLLAARHAPRVRSLVALMTSSGNPRLPGPSLKLRMRLLTRPRLRDRESIIRYSMETWRLIGSPKYPADERALRLKVENSHDRCLYPPGLARQTLAIIASGSRLHLLRHIRAPTLVIHGQDDPLVPVAAAHELAHHIPGARVEIIPGMGHDLPPELLPRLADLVVRHARESA